MNNPQDITKEIFDTVIIKEKKPAVLLFCTEWSGKSQIMTSMIERISEEFNNNIQFFCVDSEREKEISDFFGIFTVPTTIMLKDGEVKQLIRGIAPAFRVKKILEEIYIDN